MATDSPKLAEEHHEKLSRLPDGVKVEKRPLLRRALVSPYAGRQHPKVIYLSSKTPFMSAFKRVKQLLRHVESRETQSELQRARKGRRRGKGGKPDFVAAAGHPDDEASEPVYVKATGKAIDKALQLGLYLQQQTDLEVEIKTGSVDAIDDLVRKDEGQTGGSMIESDEDLPEARIRTTSLITIEVRLRR